MTIDTDKMKEDLNKLIVFRREKKDIEEYIDDILKYVAERIDPSIEVRIGFENEDRWVYVKTQEATEALISLLNQIAHEHNMGAVECGLRILKNAKIGEE